MKEKGHEEFVALMKERKALIDGGMSKEEAEKQLLEKYKDELA